MPDMRIGVWDSREDSNRRLVRTWSSCWPVPNEVDGLDDERSDEGSGDLYLLRWAGLMPLACSRMPWRLKVEGEERETEAEPVSDMSSRPSTNKRHARVSPVLCEIKDRKDCQYRT